MNLEQITPIGNELAIVWDDGIETYLSIEAVRRCCPCASCQGEPDAMGRVVKPPVDYSAKSFELIEISHVGGYAVQLRWADGHGTGIYSFEYLRSLN